MLRRFVAASSLALLVVSSWSGCALDPLPIEEGPIEIDRPAGCHPLGATDACMFPFPSSFHQVADPSSPTGVRLAIDGALLPTSQPVEPPSPPLDVAPYNAADGFSPVMPILLHFGVNVDTRELAGIDTIGRSMEEGAMVALVDMETGERVPHFVEMDANQKDGYPGRYAFIVRPMAPMRMGARMAVLVKRGLVDESGAAIERTPAFEALATGRPTNNAEVEAIRPATEEVLAFADANGYPRAELLTAFDFQVASRDWLLGPVLSMRDEAIRVSEDGGLGYTIDQIDEDPNEDVSKLVFGTFEVPSFLADDDTIEHEADHTPIRQAEDRSYPFTMIVPKRAEAGDPLPLVILGHGIFGSGRDFLTGGDGRAIQELAEEFGAVVIATDWIGLSSSDLLRIGEEVVVDLNRLPLITDQLQQALVNVLTMTRLAMGPLKDDASLTFGGPLVDPTRVYYWGASLGGIQGTNYISISPDISRAVFGVPGAAWSTMLTRSIVFSPIKVFLDPRFPDPLDLTLLLTMAQLQFDFVDPANLGKLMFEDPLPDAPPGRIAIWQTAIGDSQVPNVSTDILIRAVGAGALGPLHYEPYGVDVVDASDGRSCLVQYRLPEWNQPEPPKTNTAPSSDNGVHHEMNFEPAAHAQIAALFFSGEIAQTCSGTCDPD
jgi:hypothetical protein